MDAKLASEFQKAFKDAGSRGVYRIEIDDAVVCRIAWAFVRSKTECDRACGYSDV